MSLEVTYRGLWGQQECALVSEAYAPGRYRAAAWLLVGGYSCPFWGCVCACAASQGRESLGLWGFSLGSSLNLHSPASSLSRETLLPQGSQLSPRPLSSMWLDICDCHYAPSRGHLLMGNATQKLFSFMKYSVYAHYIFAMTLE
ncbi:hypothetical protein XENTR_v10009563 [Xenopus tropicalis]|nr:hypothetical protein XENTR_v10009563 [Xenopus tropicalis]